MSKKDVVGTVLFRNKIHRQKHKKSFFSWGEPDDKHQGL